MEDPIDIERPGAEYPADAVHIGPAADAQYVQWLRDSAPTAPFPQSALRPFEATYHECNRLARQAQTAGDRQAMSGHILAAGDALGAMQVVLDRVAGEWLSGFVLALEHRPQETLEAIDRALSQSAIQTEISGHARAIFALERGRK